MTAHYKQSNKKYRPWVFWDTSTQRQIRPFRPTHPRRGWELPSFIMESQYATPQGQLLRLNRKLLQYSKRDTGGGVWLEKFHYFIIAPSTQTTNLSSPFLRRSFLTAHPDWHRGICHGIMQKYPLQTLYPGHPIALHESWSVTPNHCSLHYKDTSNIAYQITTNKRRNNKG